MTGIRICGSFCLLLLVCLSSGCQQNTRGLREEVVGVGSAKDATESWWAQIHIAEPEAEGEWFGLDTASGIHCCLRLSHGGKALFADEGVADEGRTLAGQWRLVDDTIQIEVPKFGWQPELYFKGSLRSMLSSNEILIVLYRPSEDGGGAKYLLRRSQDVDDTRRRLRRKLDESLEGAGNGPGDGGAVSIFNN